MFNSKDIQKELESNHKIVLKPYFYGFSKTLKVSFPRDQLWSRRKETLFQYRKGIAYINRLLTGTETKFLFLEIKVGPEEKKLLRFLKNRKNTVLSDSSITKKLKDMGYSYLAPTPWLKLSKSQIEAREKCAKESSVVNWNNAIYIDEAEFYGGDVTHKKWVSASEEYSVKRTRAKFKCNVFSLINITGILTFELFEGGFNNDKFLDILIRNLKFIKQAWGENIILVADNWSVHKNAAAKEFYMKNKIRCIEWPSYSPDLNPIENLWGLMKEKLSKINIKTKQELKDKVIEIKEEIEGSFIENCIYSMRKRLKEVIRLKEIKLCIKFINFNDSSNIFVIFLFTIFSKNFVDIFEKFVDIFVPTPVL